ncbi:hypothetical protein ACFSKU_08510 [Pontibacter silvestris]|uniref:DUF4369 domain-containing protein n=1 Tax=Pontibacter silvestris TaxID=2305183 RepID=A0ABW4WYH8_9BACT|nr:hypothetical protein [Pontibacter silvestris]MCC9137419.1 hypothetical protein [Pontibacter silvestris]
MKRYISHLYYMLLLSLLSIPALADNVPQAWQQGTVFLDDDVIKGEVHYDNELDVLFYKDAGITKAFTAQTVRSFNFKDEEMGVTRTFTSLTQKLNDLPGQKEFYEIVIDGEIVLARRSKTSRMARKKYIIPILSNLLATSQAQNNATYNYYIVNNKELTKIKNFRKQVLPLMADREEEMNQFMHDYDFQLHKPTSYILLVNYYNHLMKENFTAHK